jgi:hypothetical protein
LPPLCFSLSSLVLLLSSLELVATRALVVLVTRGSLILQH